MDKYYIYEESHHTGPYKLNELLRRYRDERSRLKVKYWKEGMAAYTDINELYKEHPTSEQDDDQNDLSAETSATLYSPSAPTSGTIEFDANGKAARNAIKIKMFVPLLANEDSMVRHRAAEMLNDIDPDWGKTESARDGVPTLIGALLSTFKTYDQCETEHQRKTYKQQQLSYHPWDQQSMLYEDILKALDKIPDWGAMAAARNATPRLIPLLGESRTRQGGTTKTQKRAAEILARVGDARAVEPLISALADAEIAKEVASSLWKVLNAAAGTLTVEVLESIAKRTHNVVRAQYSVDCSRTRSLEPVDCSHLRQLARQELIRRGLKA